MKGPCALSPGHEEGGFFPGIWCAASWGRSTYSITLSTEVIRARRSVFSFIRKGMKVQAWRMIQFTAARFSY